MHEAEVIIPVKELIFYFINFFIFAGLLIFILRKPLINIFAARRNQYIASKEEAENLYNNATAENQDISKKISNIARESDDFISNIKKQSVSYGEKLISDAHSQAEYIKKETKELLETEKETYIKETRNKLVAKVVGRAKNELNSEVDSGKRKSYLNDYSKQAGH
jgi:F0F1-type ATP synthase membrane subunit b/b'